MIKHHHHRVRLTSRRTHRTKTFQICTFVNELRPQRNVYLSVACLLCIPLEQHRPSQSMTRPYIHILFNIPCVNCSSALAIDFHFHLNTETSPPSVVFAPVDFACNIYSSLLVSTPSTWHTVASSRCLSPRCLHPFTRCIGTRKRTHSPTLPSQTGGKCTVAPEKLMIIAVKHYSEIERANRGKCRGSYDQIHGVHGGSVCGAKHVYTYIFIYTWAKDEWIV